MAVVEQDTEDLVRRERLEDIAIQSVLLARLPTRSIIEVADTVTLIVHTPGKKQKQKSTRKDWGTIKLVPRGAQKYS